MDLSHHVPSTSTFYCSHGRQERGTGRTYKLINRFTYYIMGDYSLKPHINGGLQGHDESATKIFMAANKALLGGRLPNLSDSLRGVFPIGKTIPVMHSILQLPCNFSNVLPSNCASPCICKCHPNRPRLSAVAERCGCAPGRRAVRLCAWSPSGAAVRARGAMRLGLVLARCC